MAYCWRYAIHQYLIKANEEAAKEIKENRLCYIQSLLKCRELYIKLMPDIIKLQKIGDPNDKKIRIPTLVESRLNTQQMILAVQKLYEVLELA